MKKGQLDKARAVLDRLRGQSPGSQLVEVELGEIVANAEVEARAIPTGKRFASWRACFSGSVFKSSSNLRRTFLGTSLQARPLSSSFFSARSKLTRCAQ